MPYNAYDAPLRGPGCNLCNSAAGWKRGFDSLLHSSNTEHTAMMCAKQDFHSQYVFCTYPAAGHAFAEPLKCSVQPISKVTEGMQASCPAMPNSGRRAACCIRCKYHKSGEEQIIRGRCVVDAFIRFRALPSRHAPDPIAGQMPGLPCFHFVNCAYQSRHLPYMYYRQGPSRFLKQTWWFSGYSDSSDCAHVATPSRDMVTTPSLRTFHLFGMFMLQSL